MNRYIPPNFEIIQKSVVGDANAMQKVLAHYNAYILYFTKQTVLSIMCMRRKFGQS